MANPLVPTKDIFSKEDRVRKVEFLPVPNITADFQVNLNTEALLQTIVDMWDQFVGVVRLEGLKKTYRNAASGTPATGKITVVAKGRLVDGETVTIPDGVTTVVFEFDLDGGGVGGGNAQVDLSAATSVDDVRDALIAAINGSALTINATPTRVLSDAGGGLGTGLELDLENTATVTSLAVATAQNAVVTDTVADESFTHRGMLGASPLEAQGRIIIPDPSELVDQETFTIQGNVTRVFEFDNDATSTGDVAINLIPLVVDSDVQASVNTAINSVTGDTFVESVEDPVAAVGYITALEPSGYTDGETITLNDGANTPTVFEFDVTGNGAAGGNVAINVSTATDFRDVRTAIINAINGAATLGITAFNRGFGSRVNLTNDIPGSAGNNAIISAVANDLFEFEGMVSGAASVRLSHQTAGTAKNLPISKTVESAEFSIEGMTGGKDAGWDVTPGAAAFSGYTVDMFDPIGRLPAVVGEQNFLVVRVKERQVTVDTDPDIVNVSVPGIIGSFPGANQYRWDSELLIVGVSEEPPILVNNETSVKDGRLAEFDQVNGESILTEIPIRSTKFGDFLEPQVVTTKVSKIGDTMTGDLLIAHPTPGSSYDLGADAGDEQTKWNAFFNTIKAIGVAEFLATVTVGDSIVTGGAAGQTIGEPASNPSVRFDVYAQVLDALGSAFISGTLTTEDLAVIGGTLQIDGSLIAGNLGLQLGDIAGAVAARFDIGANTINAGNKSVLGTNLLGSIADAEIPRLEIVPSTFAGVDYTLIMECSPVGSTHSYRKYVSQAGNLVETINAVWNNTTNLWTKDSNGIRATRRSQSNQTFQMEVMSDTDDTPWADAAWQVARSQLIEVPVAPMHWRESGSWTGPGSAFGLVNSQWSNVATSAGQTLQVPILGTEVGDWLHEIRLYIETNNNPDLFQGAIQRIDKLGNSAQRGALLGQSPASGTYFTMVANPDFVGNVPIDLETEYTWHTQYTHTGVASSSFAITYASLIISKPWRDFILPF